MAGLGSIGLLLLAVLLPDLAATWRDYKAAEHLEHSNNVVGDIVEALENLARERGYMTVLLHEPAPLAEARRAELDGWRKAGDAALDTALQALTANPSIDVPKLRAWVAEQYARIVALRREADAAATAPSTARDVTLAARWSASSSDAVGALKTLTVALDANMRGRSPASAALADLRLAAFDLRDAAGLEASMLATAMVSGRALSVAEQAALAALRAQIAFAWTKILGLDPVLADAETGAVIARVRDEFTERFAPLRDAVYQAADGQSAYPVAAQEFGAQAAAVLDGIVNIVEAAQRLGARLAANQRDAALRSLVLDAGNGLLLFLLLAAIAGLTLAGIVRPIEQITAAMRRIAAGEPDLTLPAPDRSDEIGTMVAALRDYRRTIGAREAALAELARGHDELARNIPDMIFRLRRRCDGRERFEYVSPRCLALNGIAADVVLEDPELLFSFYPIAARDEFRRQLDESRAYLAPFHWEGSYEIGGRRRWMRFEAMPRRLTDGSTVWEGVQAEITALKEAQEAMADYARRLELAEHEGGMGHWRLDLRTQRITWSDGLLRIYGFSADSWPPAHETWRSAYLPEDRARIEAAVETAWRTGAGFRLDARLRRTDGAERVIEIAGRCEQDADGEVVALFGVSRDITERKEIENRPAALAQDLERRVEERTAAVSASEARLRAILDNVADMVVTIDEQGRIESFNPAAEAALGYSAAEATGRNVSMLMAEPDRGRHDEYLRRYRETGISRVLGQGRREVTALRKDGVPVAVELTVGEMKCGGRHVFIGTMRDVTQRKRIEDELRRSEQQLRLINNALPVLIAYVDADLRFQYVNDRFGEWRRMPTAEAIGRLVRDVMGDFAFSLARPHLEAALLGEARSYDAEIPFPDGKHRAVHVCYVPHVGPGGRVVGIFALIEDVTERRCAEQALRDSQRRLANTQRIAQLGSWEWSAVTGASQWSEETFRILGLDPRQVPATYEVFLERVHPEDKDAFEAIVDAALGGGRLYRNEFRIIRPNGEIRHLHDEGEVTFDESGRPLRMSGAVQDITERRAMEEQLKQAQKMEAVGQLTGGIAHDFNNLLGVIVGNLDLLAIRLADRPEERLLLQRASGAAERGASLTHRLLAFSRRQELEPRLTDIDRLVVEMSELLKRTLGEAVEVRTLAGGAGCSLVDPAQLESSILNLAINARDAMPEGGCLTIATAGETFDEKGAAAGLAPGNYVVIAITDNGHGMPPEIQARAFEPFFTTKQGGKGSGLGLSMVYGFVKQSGGHVAIDSTVGRGTTVRICLPRTETDGGGAAAPGAGSSAAAGRGQAVLVVEDNPAMRDFSCNALRELGYEAIVTEDATGALDLLDRRANIAVLFTDVILGTGMSGFDLAREAKRRRPDLKVLFMSGFVEGETLLSQGLGPGEAFLTKPFRAAELGARLARIIGVRKP